MEQMTIEVNKAKANLDTAEKDLRNMSTLNKVPYAMPEWLAALDYHFPGSQVVTRRPIGEVAGIPASHCSSLQTGLPISSFQSWILWQGALRSCSRNVAVEGGTFRFIKYIVLCSNRTLGANRRTSPNPRNTRQRPSFTEWRREVLFYHLPVAIPMGINWLPAPVSRWVLRSHRNWIVAHSLLRRV